MRRSDEAARLPDGARRLARSRRLRKLAQLASADTLLSDAYSAEVANRAVCHHSFHGEWIDLATASRPYASGNQFRPLVIGVSASAETQSQDVGDFPLERAMSRLKIKF